MSIRAVQCPTEAEINQQKRLLKGFDQYANAYDKHAVVQKTVAAYALDSLATTLHQLCDNKVLLDLGCGTSNYLHKLGQLANTTIGVDVSHNMLCQSMAKQSEDEHHPAFFVNADAENLPLSDNSVDTVFSSMAMQWCLSPERLMNEVYRVLKPAGKGMLAILIDKSFSSVHSAYEALGIESRLNTFYNADEWLECAHTLSWFIEHEIKTFSTHHHSVIEMLRSIKKVGAGTKYKKLSRIDNLSQPIMGISKKELNGLSQILSQSRMGRTKKTNEPVNTAANSAKALSPTSALLSDTSTPYSLDYEVLFLSIKKYQ